MPAKLPPIVVLEPVLVRDHSRRLRLVIDLLEQELRQQLAPPRHDSERPVQMEVHTDEDCSYLRPHIQRAATAK